MTLSRFDLADLRSPAALADEIYRGLQYLQPPFDVEAIAMALDIEHIALDPFNGFEGMLLTDKVRSRGSIMANTQRGDRRARFTVAHELGHFLMELHELSSLTGFKCHNTDLSEARSKRQHERQ